jgi:subtilisin family serine protease
VLDSGVQPVAGLSGPRVRQLDADGEATDRYDGHGHGTCCASLIGSDTDQAWGLAPEAEIAAIRVTGASGRPTLRRVEKALRLAAQIADIVSCSFVIQRVSPRLREAVRDVHNAGAIVVGAAGNADEIESAFPEETPHVLTVAGVDRHRRPLPGKRRGTWIDVAAPAEDLRVMTNSGRPFDGFGETSGAAALVSGVAALMLSMTPRGPQRRSLARIFEGLLYATATDVAAPGPDTETGAGIIAPIALLERVRRFSNQGA